MEALDLLLHCIRGDTELVIGGTTLSLLSLSTPFCTSTEVFGKTNVGISGDLWLEAVLPPRFLGYLKSLPL